MIPNVKIESLVETSRFPKTKHEKLILCVYFLFGAVLSVLRVFIAVLFSIILSNYSNVQRPLLKVMLGVLGFIVIEKKDSASKNCKVLVSNHLSIFDHIALHLATGTYTPTKMLSMPMAYFCGFVSSLPQANLATESIVLKQFISNEQEKNSLLLFPEGASTNGKCALLRFSTLPAVISDSLQPVVITITRPSFANLNISVLGSKNIFDIFWFFFVPYTKFEYKLLEVITRSEDESNDTLMSRVEIAISQELNISTSNISKNDKEEYKKKYFLKLAENTRKQNNDPEILRMAAQVSDVLPNVPQNAIIANLRQTRSVDITISNILDGTDNFIPLPKFSKEPKTAPKKTVPNNFGVGSLMERKTKLIDEARQRYIEKHGLHHLVYQLGSAKRDK